MATFINTPDQANKRPTPGERSVYRRLRDFLDDDYLCWFDVPIGDKRRYPDFVIVHPSRGLLVLEVKDWSISTIRNIDKLRVELLTADGRVKKEANPLEQARTCMMEVVETLARDPLLREKIGRYEGKACFPYGHGTVLTNITRKQLNESLSLEEQELVLPPHLVFCKDEVTESTDASAFEERLWGMFQYSFYHSLTPAQIDRVRWHLFPELRIDHSQDELVFHQGHPADSPATNSAEPAHQIDPAQSPEFRQQPRAVPELIKVMDLQQEQLARSLGSGHRVIHGVAGSGKTLILGYRGIQLAQALEQPILALCFNVTLAAQLRVFFAKRHLAEKVHVYHFHEWCSHLLRTHHLGLVAPENKRPWERQVETVIQGVNAGLIPRAQYGAVMIDEGHDFEPEWLRLVSQMVNPDTDSMLLLYDDAQSIYRKSSGLKFSLSSVGIKAQGRTTILRTNYRNTREIITYAYRFAGNVLSPRDADDDHVPMLQPESAGGTGPAPVYRSFDTIDDEIDYAVRCLTKWTAAGYPMNEMAVVCVTKSHGARISARLNSAGVPHLWMSSRKAKSAYDPEQPTINILTASSSKGLEFDTVILVGVGQLAKEGSEPTSEAIKLLYVGMTRARERLIVSASRANAYTEKLRALTAG